MVIWDASQKIKVVLNDAEKNNRDVHSPLFEVNLL